MEPFHVFHINVLFGKNLPISFKFKPMNEYDAFW